MAANQLIALGLLLTTSGLAQSTPSAAQPSSAFYGVGVTGFATTQPKESGFLVVATEISQSAQIWSLSETDAILLANHKLQTSARTGLATPMRKFGAAELFLLGDAGVASSGTNTGGAYAGGAILTIPFKSKYVVFPGFRYLHTATGGSQLTIGIGIGIKEKP